MLFRIKYVKKYAAMVFQYLFKNTASSSKNTKYQYFQKLHRGFSFLDILKMSIFQKPPPTFFLCFHNILNNFMKSSQLQKISIQTIAFEDLSTCVSFVSCFTTLFCKTSRSPSPNDSLINL